MSISEAKRTFAPFVLASSITSFLLLTFVRSHAGIFSNFSHSLSAAAFAAGIFMRNNFWTHAPLRGICERANMARDWSSLEATTPSSGSRGNVFVVSKQEDQCDVDEVHEQPTLYRSQTYGSDRGKHLPEDSRVLCTRQVSQYGRPIVDVGSIGSTCPPSDANMIFSAILQTLRLEIVLRESMKHHGVRKGALWDQDVQVCMRVSSVRLSMSNVQWYGWHIFDRLAPLLHGCIECVRWWEHCSDADKYPTFWTISQQDHWIQHGARACSLCIGFKLPSTYSGLRKERLNNEFQTCSFPIFVRNCARCWLPLIQRMEVCSRCWPEGHPGRRHHSEMLELSLPTHVCRVRTQVWTRSQCHGCRNPRSRHAVRRTEFAWDAKVFPLEVCADENARTGPTTECSLESENCA